MSGSAPFGIYVYGYNQYVSYGYPGGLALEFIHPRGDTNPPICDLWQVDDITYAGSGTDDRPSEDVNGNDILDPGEDLNGNGLIDEDTGIFRVELEPGSTNLLLTVDPFIPGDSTVGYTVTLIDTSQDGSGTVKVTDGAGNDCTSEISISVEVQQPELCPDEYRWNTAVSPTGYEWDPFPALFRSWNDVHFINSGPGDAFSVTATISYAPVNVVIVDGDVTLGDIPAGGSAWSQDFFKLEVDMTNPQDPNEGIKWTVEYDDAAGNHHVILDVPEFCVPT
jgi:hypothetical protein